MGALNKTGDEIVVSVNLFNQTLFDEALSLAIKIHTPHKRRDGSPYFSHIETVMENLEIMGYTKKAFDSFFIVAVLHDTLEMGNMENRNEVITLLEKTEQGKALMGSVLLLTHKDGESYEDYITKLSEHRTARIVKIADIIANLCDTPTENQKKKYRYALLKLTGKKP